MVINRDFFVTGNVANKNKILNVCNIIKKYNKSYDCVLNIIDNEKTFSGDYYNCVKESRLFLLVLPGDADSFISAGIAYGFGKKCYAIGDVDNFCLHNIFENIFLNEDELVDFLTNLNKI